MTSNSQPRPAARLPTVTHIRNLVLNEFNTKIPNAWLRKRSLYAPLALISGVLHQT